DDSRQSELFGVMLDTIGPSVKEVRAAEHDPRLAYTSGGVARAHTEPEPLEACEHCDGAHAAGESCGMLEDGWKLAPGGAGPRSTGLPHESERPAEYVREHAAPVREVLRRAGLSMAAELTPEEAARARHAAALEPEAFTDGRAVRNYI